MANKIILILLQFMATLNCVNYNAQKLVLQDVYYGGVSAAGFSKGVSAANGLSDTIPIYIETNSSIRKAYLLCLRYQNPSKTPIKVNNSNYTLDSSSEVSSFMIHGSGHSYKSGIHLIDITSAIISTQQFVYIETPQQSFGTETFFSSVFLYIQYENSLLPKINFNLLINNKDLEETNSISFTASGLNPINTTHQCGFSINTDRIQDHTTYNDGSYLMFNSSNIGLIGGVDAINYLWQGAGVKGHFYYQNNVLFGLDDDTPDNLMANSDGLADVSALINNNSTSFNFNFTWADAISSSRYNIYTSFQTAYTTPCDTFTVIIPSEVSICRGDTATIPVSGGNNYEWTPQIGLSCYNCPNPVVTADSNMYYSLRVWNTDSCSKVLPIKINVLELPEISAVTVWDTPCTVSIGQISVEDEAFLFSTYTLNDTLTQFSNHFYSLASGVYQVAVSDTNSCTRDTLITVNSFNNVIADFNANPHLGDIPFDVKFTNTSTSATDYIWYVEDDTLTTTDVNHIFEQEGVFEVTLVAMDQYPVCSDTIVSVIIAETPFRIFAPTLVNQSNGVYSITISGTTSLDYHLYDDLGQLLFRQNIATTMDGVLPLWSMNKVSKGIYFYTINALSEEGVSKVFSGKVVVM